MTLYATINFSSLIICEEELEAFCSKVVSLFIGLQSNCKVLQGRSKLVSCLMRDKMIAFINAGSIKKSAFSILHQLLKDKFLDKKTSRVKVASLC